MTKSKFRDLVFKILKLLYHSKKIENQNKPIQTTLKIIRDSSDSDLENAKTTTDSSSSEPLIEIAEKVVEKHSSEFSSNLEEIDLQQDEFY